jgi:hypothetical protein
VTDDIVRCVQIGERVWKYHESVGWYDADGDDPTFGDEDLLLDEIERLRDIIADVALCGRSIVEITNNKAVRGD